MMKRLLSAIFLWSLCLGAFSQTSPGDFAFIGYNVDNDDNFLIVALVDIPASSQYYFTDNEPNGSGGLTSGEGIIGWQTPASVLTAGTVIEFTDTDSGTNGSFGASQGTLSAVSGSMNMAGGGDAIFMYTSSDGGTTTDSYVAGFQNENNNTGSNFASTGLTSGSTFIEAYPSGSPDGGKFTGARDDQATFADYITQIANTANWTFETSTGGNVLPFDQTAFTTTGSPGATIVAFSSATSSLAEDGLFLDVTLSITNEDATNATTVEIALDGASTATNGADYDDGAGSPAAIVFPQTITFPAGSSADQTFSIFISNDDTDIEGDETIVLNLQNVAGGNVAIIGGTSTHTVTIFDNDFANFCTDPAWNIISTQTNTSGSNGGEWVFDGGTLTYSANGYCGSGCAEPVDSWLIFGPLDLSSTAYTNLAFTVDENFGTTDLVLAYSTDYALDPCPSSASWNTLTTITEDGNHNESLGSAMGEDSVFVAFQYNDDGADGYSNWEISGIFFEADVCPTVGTFPANGCVTCTATVAETGASCDAETSGVDTYTATFSYDASSEVEDLSVTVNEGTPSLATIVAGTTGTLTVTGVSEGTDCSVTMTNTLCTIGATQISPSCVEPQNPTCGVGETSLVFDPFEANTTANTVNPATYDTGSDVWGLRSSIDAIAAPFAGGEFWAMEDLDNGNGGGSFDHELTYDMNFVEGEYSSLNVSFYYYTSNLNGTDHLGYKYSVDGGTQVVVDQAHADALLPNTGAWTEVTVSIPLTPSSTSAQFVLYGFQNGGNQYCGFDELNICGSTVPACTASLSAGTATCDAVTPGPDTYTATFDFDASGETADLSISATAGVPDLISVTAGTTGTITVSGIAEGTDVELTLSNVSCSLTETVSSPVCEPLPEIAITEIMYNTTSTDDEWIEICNTGAIDIDLNGYEVEVNGTVRYTFTSGTLVAGACATVALGDNGNAPYNTACPFVADYGTPSGTNILSNSAATITLTDGTITVDEVAYDDADGADGNNASLHVIDVNADNSDTGSNWQEVADGGSPGMNSLMSKCAENDDCTNAIDISVSEFGVSAWTTTRLGGLESLPACEAGDANDDIWFSFVASSENDVVIARDLLGSFDAVIEVFDGCGGTSLGCFNNYPAGAAESALVGGLTAGNTYYFRVYDAASAAGAGQMVQVQVKGFNDSGLQSNYCDQNYDLSNSIYAERDDLGQMYSNPAVPVKGYAFRFTESGTSNEVEYTHPIQAPYMTLANAGSLEYGKTYDVSVRHRINLHVNGTVQSVWSDFGTSCAITILGTPPSTQLQPEFCPTLTDLYLDDQIQAVPVAGASQYRFTFVGASETFVETSSNYALFLYNVGTPGNGLEYSSSTYTVVVEALVNGTWSAPGDGCTITMASQPQDTQLMTSYCGGTYDYPSSQHVLAEYVYGADQYEFRFTPIGGGAAMTELRPGLSFYFHTTSLVFETGDYDVEVRARAGGVWGAYSGSCVISVNAGGSMAMQPSPIEFGKAFDSELTFETRLFPNPSAGEFMINFSSQEEMASTIQLSILDISGKEVFVDRVSVKGNSANIRVNATENLTAGLYLVRIQYEGQVRTERLIVK